MYKIINMLNEIDTGKNMQNILVTGGLGYIGANTVVELVKSNYQPIIIDNLSNSDLARLNELKQICNQDIAHYNIDIADIEQLQNVFNNHKIDCVIHFAAQKSVPESVANPLKYYENNIMGLSKLLQVMQTNDVKNIVFSSSAAVYGNADSPVREDTPMGELANPYAYTKIINEQMLRDWHNVHKDWGISILRYFNPVGFHESGMLRDIYNKTPNLIQYIVQVATGQREKLSVFGNDYDTHDGTGIRDYIHITDLANGHVQALNNLNNNLSVYNLGTGTGYSVFDLMHAVQNVNNITIPYVIEPRRVGDIAISFADATKAKNELNWTAVKTLNDMAKI